MKKQSLHDPINSYARREIKGYASLEELALDLIWSWNHSADKVWQQLDPDLWELTHNPWVVLQTISDEKVKTLLEDPAFRQNVENLLQEKRQETTSPAWFQKNHPKSPLTCIAYFSMEFMLSEALPIYSGGLGNVAGDQLKSASDLGVPVVAVGLFYQQGYFRQVINKDGSQQAFYPYNDPGQVPIIPLRKPNGEWLRLEIALPGWSVWLRTWEVTVGRIKLYLLDSNDAANFPVHRGITSELYGGGTELRLKQELILGIGGWRLLDALGIKPEVCHLNEGHAAFAVLERTKSFMKDTGLSFEAALSATRAGNLFTTHTAVPAGFDLFSPSLIEQYLGKYAQNQLGIPIEALLALGRKNPGDRNEDFNMAYLAIHGCGACNGVSILHGKVSRYIFSSLFPHWPQNEVPVGHVTNGVHTPSWDSVMSDDLWTQACGKSRWRITTENLEKDIHKISDAKLWQMRNESRKALVAYACDRLAKQLAARGEAQDIIDRIKQLFDPNTLTLGFARRFATYKRPNLLLHDQERFIRILNNSHQPVQLIIAGKAHPKDIPGQQLIKEWMHFIQRPEVRAHVIFLGDYDMILTEQLVQGVDVWINTPRRPWEACGTSGMKILVNGGLNLSVLDGWWAEAYQPEVGWALGDGQEHGDDPSWDAKDAYALYDLLEKNVIPEFYKRDQEGIPIAWTSKMRESMAKLTPQFSANRSVREYTEKYYIPGAINYLKRAANKASSNQLVNWKHTIENNWSKLRFGEVKIDTRGNQYLFEVSLYVDDLDPNMIKVELYADELNGNTSVKVEMKRIREMTGSANIYVYQASVPTSRPSNHYTPRAIPDFPEASIPLEINKILWQR